MFFSSFLWTGTTFNFFHKSRNFFSFKVVANNNKRGKAIGSPQICIIFIEILSQSCALFALKVFMISDISFWLTGKELILTFILYANWSSVFPLFICAHIDAKKSLERLAFTQKSEIDLLLTSKGGIDGIFLLYKNWFNIDQYLRVVKFASHS